MNYPVLTEEIIYTVSDLTAGVFLVLLIISIALQVEKRRYPVHLLAAAVMELTGMLLRLFAVTVEKIPDDFAWMRKTLFLMPVASDVIWILSFLLITIGIAESAVYVIYINGGKDKSRFRNRSVANGIIFAAGTIAYLCTGRFNSLQIIRGLCDTDPVRTRDTLDAFSEYLRGNLESLTVEELIPFERELEITQAYLELERLSGLRRFVADYSLEVTDFMLPPLVLQPVVENAVKHGTERSAFDKDTEDAGITIITIATRKFGGYICIEVTDRTEWRDATAAGSHDRAPETAKNRNKRKNVGLENVRTRLAIQSSGTLGMESIDSGIKVTIMLPEPQILNKPQNILDNETIQLKSRMICCAYDAQFFV